MWSQFVLVLFVGLAYASTNPAWKENSEYVYDVNGRTLSSLHEADDIYSGILLKAKLHIWMRTDGKLQGKISDSQYAYIQSELREGWKSEIPESQISYKQLPLSQKPFQMVMENGLLQKLIVEKELTNWEANIIKSIMSQFQMDLKGQNVMNSPINDMPTTDSMEGVFKTMEETVTGKTETLYDIHPLPEYLLQSEPSWVPQEKMMEDGYVIEVIKSKNFTNAESRPSYHYGFGKIAESEPTSNKIGQFFIRESNSRAILAGKSSRYVIQNSYTVNKIMVNPALNNKEMGSVISMVNVTLAEVSAQKQPEEMSDPMDIGNLVYTYENPFSKNNQVHQKLESLLKEDSSSEESTERVWRRFRRAPSQMIYKRDDERSSVEYMQHQRAPQMSQAPEFPLLPAMMGYHGKSIRENSDFDIKQNVEKLVQEISEEMQDPEKLLAESTLSKYTILSTLVRLMSEEEIKSVAEQFYTQSQQGQQMDSWVVYRDAVAEAGTGPAFQNIKQWIESKKIQSYEAAEVINRMAHAVRVPTEEYMRKFFELIKEPQVKEQEYLNETALLSYTELVYKVYINRNESHNQYPVHSFGSFYSKEGREFVKTTVIPYLTQQLQDAVKKADARKIHIYINSLGNIGHKKILEAFEPYLEGDKQVSQFQRWMMVVSLKKLVEHNPTVARSVLYKIYQNTAEMPELRIVAVYYLLSTKPSVEMLQRIAQNTNTDHQEQVNAVVKHIIESASQTESPEFDETRKATLSAKPLLTKKQYGEGEGFVNLWQYMVENMRVEQNNKYLEVCSEDSNVPKMMGLSFTERRNGVKFWYTRLVGMTSSVREIANVLYRQTESYQKQKSQRSQMYSSDNKWSSANIAQIMSYEYEEREQLEAYLIAEIESFHKVWSFDNQTLEQLPEEIREQEEIFKSGKQLSYSKLQQLKEMALSFPTEMGLPFLYTYDMPMVIKVEGKIKATATPQISKDNKLHKPEQIKAEIESYVTVSGKAQSRISFVTPFDHQIYMAGYDRNMQMHVPIKAKIEVDVKNSDAKIEFEADESHKDARLMHFSSQPYSSRSDIMTIRPVALRPNTYFMKPEERQHRHFDVTMGKKETGLALRVWGHHPSQFMSIGDVAKMLQSKKISTMWDELWDKDVLQHTEANIAIVGSRSAARKFTLRYRQEEQYKKEPDTSTEEDFLTLSQIASKLQSDEPKQRLQELMKHTGSGIKSAQLRSYEISVESDDKKNQYLFGMLNAKSNADPKSRVMIYYKNKDQGKHFAAELKGQIPNTNGLDLTDSLKTEPTAKYNMRVQHGESDSQAAKIYGEFDLRRSQNRKQYLMSEEPMYNVCKEQMQQGNFQLPACQNMTIRANFLDDIKFQLKYENLNKYLAENIEGIFKGLRVYYYPMIERQTVQSEGDNMIKGRIQFHPEEFRQVNVTVQAQDEETKMFNISTYNTMVKAILVPHPVFHLSSRVMGVVKGLERFRPTCVIDKNAAQTFSNKTYSLTLDNDYAVVMQYIPKDARMTGDDQPSVEKQLKEQSENYVVLARQVSSERKELMITFNHPESQGKTVQINMKPKEGQHSASSPAATVLVDEKEVTFSDKEIADMYDGFVQIYALPNGEVKLEIQDAFYLIFDGQRVKLTATSSTLRNSISGLCGRFSHDKYEDFTVPSRCVVRDAQTFLESYKVGNSQQRSQLRSSQSSRMCVPKVLPLYVDVISDRDAGRSENTQGQRSTGTKLRHRYVEENDEICFTIRPIPVCNNMPRETVTKNIAVHCVQATKATTYLKSQIDQGGNPDFSRKSETKKIRMDVPLRCS